MNIKYIIFSLAVLTGTSCWSAPNNPNATLLNNTLLLEAVKENDLNGLTQALENGASVDATDDYGNTALIWAARIGHGKIVTILLEKKARVNPIDENGHTAFMWAARNRHRKIVVMLFKKMSTTQIIRDISVIIRKNLIPLSILALLIYKLHRAFIDLKLKQHQDAVNEEFLRAVRNHDVNGLAQTLAQGADIHAIDPINLHQGAWGAARARNRKQEALDLAIRHGREDLIAELLEKRANVNATIGVAPLPPIAVAATHGHNAIVNQLIQAGANVDANDIRDRQTALMRAALHGHDAIANQLIHARANVNAATRDGDTALIYAAIYGRGAIVNQLIQARADVNATTINGRTALSAAFRWFPEAIVNSLIEAGAEMQAGADSNMVLKQAIDRNNQRVVQLLIVHNADVSDLTEEQERKLERWNLLVGG